MEKELSIYCIWVTDKEKVDKMIKLGIIDLDEDEIEEFKVKLTDCEEWLNDNNDENKQERLN